MRLLLKIRVLIIIVMLAICGCMSERMRKAREISKDLNEKDSICEVEKSDFTGRVNAMADSVLMLLSTEEKAAQTIIPAIFASSDAYTLRLIQEYGNKGYGGVVLLKGDTASAHKISDVLGDSGKVPPFMAIDAEWGLAMRLADARRYPANSELGDVGESEMFEYGRTLAGECKALGINMVLGPVVDVAKRESYIGRRSYGTDRQRVTDMGISYALGLMSGGVISVAKHFPGHGSVRGDSHRGKPIIEKSLHELDSVDLYPFKKYIETGLPAIMVGHLALPAIDSAMRPASLSKEVITGLLKEELGFRGLILTDALNMGGAEGLGADDALTAGADIILAPMDSKKALDEITAAIESGKLKGEDIDAKVRKILTWKYTLQEGEKEASGEIK